MNKRFYAIIRDLHLYLGLFFAPFVLVFSISTFFLVHAWIPTAEEPPGPPRTAQSVALAANIESLSGRARVDALRSVLDGIGVSGEMSFIRHDPKTHRLVIPVMVPGRETTVEIDLQSRTAAVTQRETGLLDALVTLHKSPGPHLADIRMNWWPMRAWRWFADGTVYLILFISVSGIYLWAVLRSERRPGLAILAAGASSFLAIVYALIR